MSLTFLKSFDNPEENFHCSMLKLSQPINKEISDKKMVLNTFFSLSLFIVKLKRKSISLIWNNEKCCARG